MPEPYLSEIKAVSFDFAPKGWALCNGQLLPINQNQALFSLLGTMYGGNGQTNFALPNLQGRTPIHIGNGFTQGQSIGSNGVTLNISQMPEHIHFLNASNTIGNAANPNFGGTGFVLAAEPGNVYSPSFAPESVALNVGSVTNVGGSQPHNNMMPYLVINYIIALQGVFPSRN